MKENAQSHCEFFTLNSHRLSIQMTSGFLVSKPHCKKNEFIVTLLAQLCSTKML